MRRHRGLRSARWRTPRYSARAGATGVGLAVLLAGCGPTAVPGTGGGPGSSSSTTGSSSTTTVTIPPPAPITWTPCQSGLQCGSVPVPLDYQDPGGPWITIAIARHLAEVPAERIGDLLINPGGPGGSGIDDLPAELSVFTSGVLARFDIVSFDPRGVDRSAPVSCGEGTAAQEASGPLPDPVPPTAAAQQAVIANDTQYALSCAKASALLLGFVDTEDVARDMDRIREALGEPTISYIGHSYGTLLGLLYAQMFPTHLRAMVLDGVIDPALSATDMVLDQAEGFEQVLDSFFAWCASTGCAWRPGADPTGALLDLAARMRATPLPAGSGRTAGPGALYTAALSALYNTSSWNELADALAQAQAGNGAQLVNMTEGYDSGNGPNAVDANNAVNCLDHSVTTKPSDFAALAAQAGTAAPVFGPMLEWGLLECAVWPAHNDRVPAPINAPGAPPIVVVGSSGDPATPHQWAVSVAAALSHGVLVTWSGAAHVAYYYSPCVRAIDEAYLLDGTLPANGTVCRD
ncbi:MAG: alpha/beta hydrolase [Acidimicrobiales bacterium]